MAGIHKLPWQTDTSIGKNSWGYVSNWITKDANTIIDDLIDIVSKKGCMLLNVGPKADGTIPDDQADILIEIGDWLSVNGAAVYGSRTWATFGEGPTESEEGYMSERKRQDNFQAEDVRFTTNNNKLYATVMDWPEDHKLTIQSLGKKSKHCKWDISTVNMLGHDGEIKWNQTDTGLHLEFPKERPCDHAFVFEMDFGSNASIATAGE